MLSVLLVLIAATVAAGAQDTPRIQVFGGYSRLQFDSKSVGFTDNTGLNGWTGSAAFNLIPEFGVVGEVGGYYGPNLRVRDWLIGPQFMYTRWHTMFFGHVLFGKADTRITTTSTSETQNGRSVAFGGGLDFPITSRLSIRAIQADYMTTKVFGADQGNVKFSTGVVYRWGAIKKPKRRL
jgi:hypothetical protein